MARARIAIKLFVSARPTVEWYRDGPALYLESERTDLGATAPPQALSTAIRRDIKLITRTSGG
jgi:hypothetical protein